MTEKWDGTTERRKSALTATEAIVAIHNECNAINERVTQHKSAQDAGFNKLESLLIEEIKKIRQLLISEDGEKGLIPRVKLLESEKESRDKTVKNITTLAIGVSVAFIISVITWIGKTALALIKIIGG